MSHPFTRRSLLAGAAAFGGAAMLPSSRGYAAPPPATGPYLPTGSSLSQHQPASWWRAAKLGIFIHWGAYSVPAWGSNVAYHSAEWYFYAMRIADTGETSTHEHHRYTYGEDYLYDSFLPQFKAERFDPRSWIELFEGAGARYFVLTSKHHDGYQLFPNTASDRNSTVIGPGRDLVGELFDAARGSSLKRGLYHSLGEFYNPALQTPPWDAYTHAPIPYTGYKPVDDYVSQYLHVMVKTLIDRYDPDVLWGDGEHWHADLGAGPAFKPQDMDWQSNDLLAYYYNGALDRPSPKDVMINDRWEADHSDFKTIEGDQSSYQLQTAPWEACLTLGRSWGYDTSENLATVKSAATCARLLVDIVSKNGNLLLNVGPRPDGTIADWQADRLRGLGAWLDINGGAIYDSVPWTRAADGDLRYTVTDDAFHIIGLTWPPLSYVTVPSDVPIASDSQVRLLGDVGHQARFRRTSDGIEIDLPATNPSGDGFPYVLEVKRAH